MWLVIEGDPGAVEHLASELVRRGYLDNEFEYELYDADPLEQARAEALAHEDAAVERAWAGGKVEGAAEEREQVRAELEKWVRDSDRDKYVAKKMLAWLDNREAGSEEASDG